MLTHNSKGKICRTPKVILPSESGGLVGQIIKGSRGTQASKPRLSACSIDEVAFFIKLSTNYMGFVAVVVRKTFCGPVGFFHGERFGAELAMEIPEFTSGNHRQRWKY